MLDLNIKLLIFYTGSLGFAMLLFFSMYKIFIDFPVKNTTLNYKRKRAIEVLLILGKYLSLSLGMIVYFSSIFPEGFARKRNIVFAVFLFLLGTAAFWQKMRTISKKAILEFKFQKLTARSNITVIDEHFRNWAFFLFVVILLITRLFYPHMGEFIFKMVSTVFWITGLYVYQTDHLLPYFFLYLMEAVGTVYLAIIFKDTIKKFKDYINAKILDYKAHY